MNHSKQNKSAKNIDIAATPSNESSAHATCAPAEMMTVKEVAGAVGLSLRKIHRMFARCEIPGGKRVGRAILFCRETLVEWIQTYGRSASAPVWASCLPRGVECPFCSAVLAPVLGQERDATYLCARPCCVWRGYRREVHVDDNGVSLDAEGASNVAGMSHLLVSNSHGKCHVLISSPKLGDPDLTIVEGQLSLLDVLANLDGGSAS